VRQFHPPFHFKAAKVSPASFAKRTLPEAFCRLVRLQVNSNVSAPEFVRQFKEFRVEPKYVATVDQTPRVVQHVGFVSNTPRSSVRIHSSSTRLPPPADLLDKDLVYLNAVGVTISISSCWHQMLQDWKIEPYGYPKFLQLLQLHYGTEHSSSGGADGSSELKNIDSDDDCEEIRVLSRKYKKRDSNSEEYTGSMSTSSWRSRVDESSTACCSLDMLKSIVLCQPQHQDFVKMERQLSELLIHPCLTIHTIETIIKHAKTDYVLKDYANESIYSNPSQIVNMHKSLLTIVNNTAFGSSGGGLLVVVAVVLSIFTFCKILLSRCQSYEFIFKCLNKQSIWKS